MELDTFQKTQVRDFTPEDWPSVCEIYDLAKPEELDGVVPKSAIPKLQYDTGMRRLFDESRILVATENTKVVGFSGHTGNSITWLFVHPKYRRRKIGSTLLTAVTQLLSGEVTLVVAKSNSAALKLYERFGFSVDKEFIGEFKGYECPAAKLRYVIDDEPSFGEENQSGRQDVERNPI